MKRKFCLSLVLVFALVLTCCNLAFAQDVPEQALPAFDKKVVSRVDAERAIEHIRYLSEEIGPRPGGLENEKEGARYIKSKLESYGYNTEFQEFSVSDQYIGYIKLPGGEVWETGAMPNSLFTGEESTVSGEVTCVEGGLSPEDFPADVDGKIVLMQRAGGDSWNDLIANVNTQVQNAVDAGARGVILYSVVGSRGNYGSAFSWVTMEEEVDIPVLGAAYIQGVWLKERINDGKDNVEIQTRRFSDLESLNVIGTKPPQNGDPEAPVVIVCAHMDSVTGAPGANDNASGTALVLELARVFRGYNTDKEIRFVTFGSEERGLLGSEYYVSQLTEEEKERIVGVFNADMVATDYEKASHLYAMTVDGEDNFVTESAVAAGARLGNSSILPGQFGASDHVYFHREGIPAALFIWMGIDSWDPLVYHIEKVYHTPQDTIENNISAERMQNALDIIGAAVFDAARKDVPALEKSKIRN